jgi:hypothetical protein
MNATHFHRAAGLGLGLLALSFFAGCTGGPAWGGWSQRPSNADMARVIENTEPVEAPAESAPLAPPGRPLRTEVTIEDDNK